MNDPPLRPTNVATTTKHLSINLTLGSTPEPQAIRAAMLSAQQTFDHYPRCQEQLPHSAFLASAVVLPQPPTDPNATAGFRLDYTLPNGLPSRVLVYSGNELQIARTEPDHIRAIGADALTEFSLILPQLAQPVVTIAVERLDRLLWHAPRSKFRACAVLREGSDWLTPKVFQATDLWHSHHGLFEYLSEPYHHRLLHVLEASARSGTDLVPPEPTATPVAVDIKQQLHIFHAMTSPESAAEPVSPDVLLIAETEGHPCLLMRYIEHLISKSKTLLRDALSPHVLETIALEHRL